MMHNSKGIAKTKKIAYQYLRNLNWFDRKRGDRYRLGPVGTNGPGYQPSSTLTENTRRMTPHMLEYLKYKLY